MSLPVYLDYNATTPLHPEVAGAMMPYLSDLFGNPSSTYLYGSQARTEVEKARVSVAALLGCKSHEIIFTSGGSESNNLAIKGVASAYVSKGKHIITSAVEHPAVSEVCRHLERQGYRITRLGVDQTGLVSPEELRHAITPDTILVTIMHANNEIGTIQPVKEIAAITREMGVLLHTDAAQSAGKIPVEGMGADLVSIAGHKLYGPKGVGALYIREGIRIDKLIHGADHEQNLRAGTENIMSIAGLGKACEVARRDLEENMAHMRSMRDVLYRLLMERFPDLRLNGHPVHRLPNTLSVSFKGIEAGVLLPAISDNVAASAGAACHAAEVTLSDTLQAIHIPMEYAAGTVRFSTGRLTTEEEVEYAANVIGAQVSQLQQGSAVGPGTPEGHKIIAQNATELSFFGGGQPSGLNDNPQGSLTHFTQGLGCACKLKPQLLHKVLADLPVHIDANLLVGTDSFDDAAVYRISDDVAIVQTVDFFTPVVDDPYDFGQVAAANALSDIYAMGAKPDFALNIAGFPSTRLSPEVLKEILRGAADKASEAGIAIVGGHTIDDTEPKFGMAVTGRVHPDRILRNSTARPGDLLVLTKPIGTGILSTALKRKLLDETTLRVLTNSMTLLNRQAAEIMLEYPVSACTDVTGFGLMGHLVEMASASAVNAEIHAGLVPLIPGTEQMAAAGVIPGGSRANLDFAEKNINWLEGISELRKIILCDAQTSGGLLISIPEPSASRMVEEMKGKGVAATIIGKISGKGNGMIKVME